MSIETLESRVRFPSTCPACGERHHNLLADHDGGAAYHLKCIACGERYEFRSQTEGERKASQAAYQRRRRERVGEDERERMREYHRRYYLDHREEILAKRRRYYEENRDKLLAYGRAWHAEHRDEQNARRRQWNMEHPERVREQRERAKLAKEKRNLEESRIRATPTCTFERTHVGVAGNWYCQCSNCKSAGQHFDERVIALPHYAFCPTCGRRIVAKVVG